MAALGTFHIKNFDRLQHYKDRSPPWIKLYNGLLDDYEFGQLPDASKAHLIAIGLLASRHNNKLPLDADWLGKRINATQQVNLQYLIESGFVVPDQSCSKALADCKQVAMPEREGEIQVKEEKEKILPADAGISKPNGHNDKFEEFWKSYPTDKNMSKKTAKMHWVKLPAEKQFAAIGAIPGFRQYCDQNKWYRPIYADRFLAQERFEGYASEPHLSPEAIADQKDRADKLMRRGKYSTGP